MIEGKKVLIIEDDFFIQNLYSRAFEKAGAQVITDNDVIGIREKLSSQRPDVILLDIMLPGKSGLEFLSDVKADEKTKNIPVILLTNVENDDVIVEGLKLGAVSYLVKSVYTPEQIVNEADKAISSAS